MGVVSLNISTGHGNMIKIVLLLSVLGLAMSAPAAPALPYLLPYTAGAYPYAVAPLAYAAPLDSGLVYPLAEPYVHDTAGDVSDDSFPAAEPYVHDTTGDVA